MDTDWTKEDERVWREMAERRRANDEIRTKAESVAALRYAADCIENGTMPAMNIRVLPIYEDHMFFPPVPRRLIGNKIVYTLMFPPQAST